MIIILGVLLALSSSVTFVPRVQNPSFVGKNSHWLPWLAFPIGVESGFSSAGAGALGTVLLLNYSEMTPAQVVGTDLVFGLVLGAIGSAVHWTFGSISTTILLQFLAGGVPGVVLGCLLAKRVPAQKLKAVVALSPFAPGCSWCGRARASQAPRHSTAAQPIGRSTPGVCGHESFLRSTRHPCCCLLVVVDPPPFVVGTESFVFAEPNMYRAPSAQTKRRSVNELAQSSCSLLQEIARPCSLMILAAFPSHRARAGRRFPLGIRKRYVRCGRSRRHVQHQNLETGTERDLPTERIGPF